MSGIEAKRAQSRDFDEAEFGAIEPKSILHRLRDATMPQPERIPDRTYDSSESVGHLLVPKSWLWGLATILLIQLGYGLISFTELKANFNNLNTNVVSRQSELDKKVDQHRSEWQAENRELKDEIRILREKLDSFIFRSPTNRR